MPGFNTISRRKCIINFRQPFFIFKFLLILFFLLLSINLNADTKDFWNDVQENIIPGTGGRYIIPQHYRTLSMNLQEMRDYLNEAPLESPIPSQTQGIVISLPMPDGSFQRFSFWESPIMAPALASKFPGMKTYVGKGIDNPDSHIRFDYTLFGFHAMILSSTGSVFIDPYRLGNTQYYISYYKKDFIPLPGNNFTEYDVLGTDSPEAKKIEELLANGYDYRTGEQLRTYRLACAATGEYTAFFGGTVNQGMAAIVTAINRVTGVYELEVSVRMVLVANNDLIVYTDPNSDPYTNNDGVAMLAQNQANLDAVIGSANYDIGHVFSTGGGGVAYLGVICNSSYKAQGVTGLSQPIGDPFYIDYVAHEMGHQYGGNHSFNGNAGACSGGNRNGPTAYEPGSGSTIMAYAGICSPQDLQLHSDAYFHGISLDEIIAYTQSGGGNSCAVITSTGNTPPTVDAGLGGYTLPVSTPFSLTGSGSDADGDSVLYCWEEFDLGPAGPPNSPSGNAPIFRSFLPTPNPTRVFPKISDIINNTQTIGEILPTYSRNLTFRLTARDYNPAGGGIAKDQISISVTNSAGPFLVTSPNTNVTWQGNSVQTVTWDVANTSVAPVNCQSVNILLSTDGGNTYPTVLSASTGNDGTEQIYLPNDPTTSARIKVEAADNVFFDISNADFTIIDNPTPVEFTLFTADVSNGIVALHWVTATETNNSGFEIEKGIDKSSLSKITFIEGHGTTTEPSSYKFLDNQINIGDYFYRLKQIDNDGSFHYSNTIEVKIDAPQSFVLEQNYPNPFNPSTIISFELPVDANVNLELFNTLGQKVDNIVNSNYSTGKHKINFNAGNFSNGVYFYKLTARGIDGSTNFAIKKMILLK
jgi:Metallo-peptidase family M12B Reprolysin-like/Secretion system C-terminal sorting domain